MKFVFYSLGSVAMVYVIAILAIKLDNDYDKWVMKNKVKECFDLQ